MPTSNPVRLWMAGGGLAALVVAALAWFFAVSPELSNASSLKSQTSDAQMQNVVLQSKLIKLQAQHDQIASLQSNLSAARAALPVDTGLADFTREAGSIAAQTGTTVTSIAVQSPVLAGSGAPAVAPAGVTMNPVGHLYALPITLIVKGWGGNELRFLTALRASGSRAALIGSTQIVADSTAGKPGTLVPGVMTVQLQIFVAPQSAADVAAMQKELATTGK